MGPRETVRCPSGLDYIEGRDENTGGYRVLVIQADEMDPQAHTRDGMPIDLPQTPRLTPEMIRAARIAGMRRMRRQGFACDVVAMFFGCNEKTVRRATSASS